mgnify:CR=1 FL=1
MKVRKWLRFTVFLLAQSVILVQTCSEKWKGFGNSCYLFVTPGESNFNVSKSNWYNARKYCIKWRGDLISLTTHKESNFVYNHTKNFAYGFWIGLRYTNINKTSSPWTWSSGEKLRITKWNKGEPNNIHVEHCTEILKKVKVWNNQACHTRLAWICEKPMSVKRQAPLVTEVPVTIAAGKSAQENNNKAKVQTCPRKWKGFGNSCYLFVTPSSTNFDADKSSWSKARKYCMEMGSDLVSLTTDEEINFVYSHSRNFAHEFWIGLRYTKATNWTWSNGEKLGVTKWNKGEPNDITRERCVQILKKLKFWNNKECHVLLAWICEKKKVIERQEQPVTDDPVAITTRKSTQENMSKDTNSSSMSVSMALYIFLPMILLALIIVIILLIRKNNIAAKKTSSGEENDGKTVNQENNDQAKTESGVYTELDDNRKPDNTYMPLVHYENPDVSSGASCATAPRRSSYVIPPPSHEYEMPDNKR